MKNENAAKKSPTSPKPRVRTGLRAGVGMGMGSTTGGAMGAAGGTALLKKR